MKTKKTQTQEIKSLKLKVNLLLMGQTVLSVVLSLLLAGLYLVVS